MRLIAEEHGVFLTQEALNFGYCDKDITRAVRARAWHRVRRGAYVPGDVWADADPVRRHLILAAAIRRSYGDKVAFSHITAALLHGIDVWGMDLSRVHVIRLDSRPARIEPDIVHHKQYSGVVEEIDRCGPDLVVPPARAALQCGLITSTESALVCLDSVLHRELATESELATMFDQVQQWPHARHLQIAVRMMDRRSGSVGESRSRWMFRCGGLPAPTLQLEVRDESGTLIGIADFAWLEHRLLGEFDGRVKYGRLLKPGQSPGDAVFSEKRREDEMRRVTRFGMFRLIWGDLDRPATTCSRAKELMDRAG